MTERSLIRTDALPDEPAQPASRGSSLGRGLRDVRSSMPALAWWVVCLWLAVVFIFPLWLMLSMALKGPAEQGQIPPTFYPHAPTLDNFTQLASDGTLL